MVCVVENLSEVLKFGDKRIVNQKKVACDGGIAGHPKVYLEIDQRLKQVTCPYCSTQYIYVDNNNKSLS